MLVYYFLKRESGLNLSYLNQSRVFSRYSQMYSYYATSYWILWSIGPSWHGNSLLISPYKSYSNLEHIPNSYWEILVATLKFQVFPNSAVFMEIKNVTDLQEPDKQHLKPQIKMLLWSQWLVSSNCSPCINKGYLNHW